MIAKNKVKTKRFDIMTILMLGSPDQWSFMILDTESFDKIMRLASFLMTLSPIAAQYGLQYVQPLLAEKIREQFPDIDFAAIENRAKSSLKGNGRNYCREESKLYKNFANQCKDSFGKTRQVAPLSTSEAQMMAEVIDNGGVEGDFYRSGNSPDWYTCSECGATSIKLWRPYGYDAPLVCAKCAQEYYDWTGTPAIPRSKSRSKYSMWGLTCAPKNAIIWWGNLPDA